MVKSHMVQEKQPFERIEVSRAEALEMFAENEFKATFLATVLFVSFLYHFAAYVKYIYDFHPFLQKSELYVQVEIINELPEDKTITVYRCGPLVDLCRGPHIPNTSFVKAFACLKVMIL
jgi:threonyl-tRNA synthetase